MTTFPGSARAARHTFRVTAGTFIGAIAGTASRFRFEIGRNSLYVSIPYVGALWIGGGMPTCFDPWRAIKGEHRA